MKTMLQDYLQCERGAFSVEYALLMAAIGALVFGALTSKSVKDADTLLWETLFKSASSKATF